MPKRMPPDGQTVARIATGCSFLPAVGDAVERSTHTTHTHTLTLHTRRTFLRFVARSLARSVVLLSRESGTHPGDFRLGVVRARWKERAAVGGTSLVLRRDASPRREHTRAGGRGFLAGRARDRRKKDAQRRHRASPFLSQSTHGGPRHMATTGPPPRSGLLGDARSRSPRRARAVGAASPAQRLAPRADADSRGRIDLPRVSLSRHTPDTTPLSYPWR